jgi:hypothetical protein
MSQGLRRQVAKFQLLWELNAGYVARRLAL